MDDLIEDVICGIFGALSGILDFLAQFTVLCDVLSFIFAALGLYGMAIMVWLVFAPREKADGFFSPYSRKK